MKQIKILGTSGVGKSILAEILKSNATANGLKVKISDHEIFSKDHSYLKVIEVMHDKCLKMGIDILILVINDGGKRLRIEFCDYFSHSALLKIFPEKEMS